MCIKKKKSVHAKVKKSEANLLEQPEIDKCDSEVVSLDEVCVLEDAAKPPSTKPWLDVQVDGAMIRFEVDTGAPVTIISAEYM